MGPWENVTLGITIVIRGKDHWDIEKFLQQDYGGHFPAVLPLTP